MAAVKGIVILNARDYVGGVVGAPAWDAVLARLPAGDPDVIASMVSVGWYDIRLYDRVCRAVAESLGPELQLSPESVMVAIGRYAAERDLKTIHRLFLRVANPAYVLERAADFWRRYQDSGTWTIERQTPTRVRATLRGWGSEDELTCVRLAAYTERLFELVGARNASLERVECRARGDEACVFDGRWD
jgi:predicted hydrocarbon binding protein